jgi:hypothetical protein
MKPNNDHPERKDLNMAARTGRVPFAEHLKSCDSCSTLFAALKWLGPETGRLEEPLPRDLVRRHKAIPLLVASLRPASTMTASRVFDTWASRPALAVRQATFGVERRVRFAVAQYEIELVANRQIQGWELAIRVYEDGAITSRFVLQTGRRKLPVGCGECFVWSSPRPPRKLDLLSPDLRIRLESLPW